MIEVQNLTKIYDNNVIAVDDVSFNLDREVFAVLLGPNGAGKSTLLNIIAGILPPSKGRVIVNGIDVWKSLSKVKKILGFVPQEYGIWEYLTVQENLSYMASLYGLSKVEFRKRMRQVLELLNLEEYKNKLAGKLSGGYKRRLSIAMALIHDPEVVIMDEPTTGLDLRVRIELVEFMRNLARDGKTVLVSTHITEDAEYSDQVLVMNRGRIIIQGEVEEIKGKFFKHDNVVELHVSKLNPQIVDKLSQDFEIYVNDEIIKVLTNNFEEVLPKIIREVEQYGISVNEVKIRKLSLQEVLLRLYCK